MESPSPSRGRSRSPPSNSKHKPHAGENEKIWFISGVSLEFPPWKSNIILSKAILLNPYHVKRLGDFSAKPPLTNNGRKRRIYVNLVILFRLLLRCQHLAFDRATFWNFIRRSWACGGSSEQIEDLVNIYADRRLVYIRSPWIRRRHVDLLTELIDAWNDRDEDPPQSKWPPSHVVNEEWTYVMNEWDELVRTDCQSLLEAANPPVLGSFSPRLDPHVPMSFKIKNAAQRAAAEADRGRELFPERAAKTANNAPPNAPKGPSAAGPYGKAVDQLIELHGQPATAQKRKSTPDTPDATPTKRQCVPEPPPSSPRSRPSPGPRRPTEEDPKSDADAIIAERGPSFDEYSPASPRPSMPPSPQRTPKELCHAAEQPKDAVLPQLDSAPLKQDAAGFQDDLQVALPDGKGEAHDDHASNQSNRDVIMPFEARLNRQHERLAAVEERANAAEEKAKTAEEQAKLLAESGDLSRDIQKAHNDLTVFTAQNCTDALAKLDVLTGELSALVEQVAACRQAAEEMQLKQEEQAKEQKYQLEAKSAGLHSRINSLQKDLRNSINDRQSTHAQLKAGLQSATKALEDVQNQQKLQAETSLKEAETVSGHMKSITTKISSIESRHESYEEDKKDIDTRLSKLESSPRQAESSSALLTELEGRLKKVEYGVTNNSKLIDNCRTLVETSKIRLDQQYSSLDNRLRLLEQQLGHRTTEQERTSKEQAERMDRLQAEFLQFKKFTRLNGE